MKLLQRGKHNIKLNINKLKEFTKKKKKKICDDVIL